MTFMRGWARDLNNTDLTFENSCLVSSLSASRLSNGRSLEYISALYVEIVNYLKSVRMTFGSPVSIACLWSVYVDVTHVISIPTFQHATLKSWDGPGYEARPCYHVLPPPILPHFLVKLTLKEHPPRAALKIGYSYC